MPHNTFQPSGTPVPQQYAPAPQQPGMAATYAAPPPNTVGPHGFLLKHGTAHDPVEAYRPQPGQQGIVVHAEYYRWWIMGPAFATAGPRIFVNGNEIPDTSWGATYLPAAPGLYHVEVHTRPPNFFFRRFVHPWWTSDTGPADTVVPVALGQQTPVYYRPAAARRMLGAIAPQPPRWPGLLWMRFSSVIIAGFIGLVLFGVLMNILD